jgi:hypothetical protein
MNLSELKEWEIELLEAGIVDQLNDGDAGGLTTAASTCEAFLSWCDSELARARREALPGLAMRTSELRSRLACYAEMIRQRQAQ